MKHVLRVARRHKREIFAVSSIAIVAIAFSLYQLPWKFIDPFSTDWVFNNSLRVRDNAGGALGTMFYMVDLWRWPIGTFDNVAAPLGSNLINWAATPWLAVLLKILYGFGLVPLKIQLVGVQVVVGWVLTPVFSYLLTRRLGAAILPSLASALAVLALGSLNERVNNQALTLQFLAILPMLLVLCKIKVRNRWNAAWPILISLSIGTNAYFFIMAIPFLLLDLHLHSKSNRIPGYLVSLLRNSWPSGLAAFLTLYIFGAFANIATSFSTDIGSINIFSTGVFGIFDGDWLVTPPASNDPELFSIEGAVYVGLSATVLFLMFLARRFFGQQSFWPRDSRISGIAVAALVLYVVSWGSNWRFLGALSFDVPIPQFLLAVESSFRAIGRFAWPLVFLVIAYSARGLTWLMAEIRSSTKPRVVKTGVASLMLVATIAAPWYESVPRIEGIKSTFEVAVNEPNILPSSWVIGTEGATTFEVVPAFDGDANGLPWRAISEVALSKNMSLDTWGFLARYSAETAGQVQAERFRIFTSCALDKNTFYIVRSEILEQVAKGCNRPFTKHFESGAWSGIRF